MIQHQPGQHQRKHLVWVDGCEPDYLAQAVATGHLPWLKKTLASGTGLITECVVPSFANPNSLSIMTGAPPSAHGICGNYLFDTASGTEVMMNDAKWLAMPRMTAVRGAAVVGHSTGGSGCWRLLPHGSNW